MVTTSGGIGPVTSEAGAPSGTPSAVTKPITAAPWENPPSTILVLGHRSTKETSDVACAHVSMLTCRGRRGMTPCRVVYRLFDPCNLVAALITVEGRNGEFAGARVVPSTMANISGPRTSEPYPFTTLNAARTTDDTVALNYKDGGHVCTACPGPLRTGGPHRLKCATSRPAAECTAASRSTPKTHNQNRRRRLHDKTSPMARVFQVSPLHGARLGCSAPESHRAGCSTSHQ